tara:strand:+ start:1577 stop:1966 length:390 start_codon:yes stop_codon:yes gene_type:complete
MNSLRDGKVQNALLLNFVGDVAHNNKNVPFIQRLTDPGGEHGAIRNKNGSLSTHRMAAEIDENGQAWAFPTIVEMSDGGLHQFDNPAEALQYNIQNGNAIKFPDIRSADEWSRNYKTPQFNEYYDKAGR